MSYLLHGINSAVKYARDGHGKQLSDLLAKKPHLINQKNKNGNSILHIACWKGNTDMVLMLLMRGADINATDSKGYTPLLVAIEFNHDDLATLLLQRGADINIANQALCLPLHVAALSGCKNVVVPLLQRGADIDAIETVRSCQNPLNYTVYISQKRRCFNFEFHLLFTLERLHAINMCYSEQA
jgi:ankyrin repeat protein